MNPLDTTAYSPALLSLLEELYNVHLPLQYINWGLLKEVPPQRVLTVENGIPTINESVLRPGVWTRTKGSFVFPIRAKNALRAYNPGEVDEYYDQYRKKNFKKLTSQERETLLLEVRRMLIENWMYALLGNLIEQYRLRSLIPEQYWKDVQAARYRALASVAAKKRTKKSFDAEYGFLAEEDTDPGCPRYQELKRLPVITDVPTRHDGPHNFREHVKFRTAKLITLYRALLLAEGKKHLLLRQEVGSQGQGLSGKVLSGKGTVRGKVRVLGKKLSLQKGEIAVTNALSPDLVVLFPKARAIIAESGGMLSHAAIVAREQGVFVLGQVPGATHTLKTGEMIEIRGTEIIRERTRPRPQ